jgi:hypothetical protein
MQFAKIKPKRDNQLLLFFVELIVQKLKNTKRIALKEISFNFDFHKQFFSFFPRLVLLLMTSKLFAWMTTIITSRTRTMIFKFLKSKFYPTTKANL